MDDKQNENIPTWTGRAVSTAELDQTDLDLARQQTASWAGSKVDDRDQTSPTSEQPTIAGAPTHGRSSSSRRIGAILAAVAVVAVGAIAWYLANGRSDDSVETSSPTTTESAGGAIAAEAPTVGGSVSGDTDPAAASDETDSSVDSVGSDAEAEVSGPDDLAPELRERYDTRAGESGQAAWALYQNSVIHLEGRVPSEALADELRTRVSALGPGMVTVVENYTVDPTASAPTDPPLYLPESVRFVEGEAEIEPASQRVVNAAPFVVLGFFPEATITIVSHPDVDEDQARADALATERAEEISRQWQSMGLKPEQISVEIADVGSADEAGSAEFEVRNLLAG